MRDGQKGQELRSRNAGLSHYSAELDPGRHEVSAGSGSVAWADCSLLIAPHPPESSPVLDSRGLLRLARHRTVIVSLAGGGGAFFACTQSSLRPDADLHADRDCAKGRRVQV